jgi:Cu+-exporting ATPase
MERKVLKISGMHCASCAVLIETALKKTEGVKTANVNFATEKLYLEFDPIEISIARIKKIIEDLGYKAREESLEEELYQKRERVKEEEISEWKRMFVFSLIFSLPIVYLTMGEMIGLPIPDLFKNYSPIIQLFFASLVIVSAFKIWRSGLKNLILLSPNMDSLIFIGTATAYFYSLIVTFFSFF